ncbi:hypothetical protein F5890DRAFT_1479104 [Lentinula detonsa]|uniref:Zn(2)-C6 fungal-type domain-containing protein n=1 Tax=Lentinula detonsa TaxID=2804962 RepID=A0AA38PNA2_9AGAR|nr:hypothetical protein F5890DRAFT_1479104 [Lentinula detonsa]
MPTILSMSQVTFWSRSGLTTIGSALALSRGSVDVQDDEESIRVKKTSGDRSFIVRTMMKKDNDPDGVQQRSKLIFKLENYLRDATKREEKKKREAEERKKIEQEEKKKREEEEARACEEEQKRKEEEIARERKEKEDKDRREMEEKDRVESELRRNAEDRAKSVGALVRDSIARKQQKEKEIQSSCDDSVLVVGKKRKRTAIIPSSAEDLDDSSDGFEPEGNDDDDDDDEDPSSPPPSPRKSPSKSPKCDRCTTKEIACNLIGEGSASCIACRKAKVKCSLVGNERIIRRSKRVKREELKREESPIASSSNQRIEVLEAQNQAFEGEIRMLAHRLFLVEDDVRLLAQSIHTKAVIPEENSKESEEDREKRTGDKKGKGRQE